MSERNVREPSQALAQRLGRMEEQMRAVKLRAWPGAIRTASTAATEPATASAWAAVLSVTAVAGRWVVFADVQLMIASTTTHYDVWVRVTVHDPATGDEITGDDVDVPDCRCSLNPFVGTVILDPKVIGHFVTNDVVTVTLSTLNMGGDIYQLAQSRLLLIPV